MAVVAWLLCCFAALPVNADDHGFTEDAKEAIARAVEQDKDIIFLFTGSDWCPPCKKLEEEVLSEKDFLFEVSKDYVLVKFDFPKSVEQPKEIAQQNKEYGSKFGVNSYPTLVLTDKYLKLSGAARRGSKTARRARRESREGRRQKGRGAG